MLFFILLLVEQLTNYGYKFPLDFLTLRWLRLLSRLLIVIASSASLRVKGQEGKSCDYSFFKFI